MLRMTSTLGSCPPGAPPGADLCAARAGLGVVRGLGVVSETYTFFVQEAKRDGDCFSRSLARACSNLRSTNTVGPCTSSALDISREFTITGGSGIYAGASGGGTVHHFAPVRDTWTGTLNVPWARIRPDAADTGGRGQQD